MTKLFTDEEQREIALSNVVYFDDFEDLQSYYNHIDSIETLNDLLKDGFLVDLSLSSEKIDDEFVIDAIKEGIEYSDFIYFMTHEVESMQNEDTSDYTIFDWIREYTEVYDVFVFNKTVYAYFD